MGKDTPENARPISQVGDVTIDQVVIGSCTNGRLEDMAIAAKILEGKKVAPNVRCIVMPATQSIYKECIQRGYITTFIDAGRSLHGRSREAYSLHRMTVLNFSLHTG